MSNPVAGIDETIHQRVRLGILALLTQRGRASFNEMKVELSLTDGNLSVHLGVLERSGLLSLSKEFVGRRPCTTACMTEPGRAAFAAYLTVLAQLVRAIPDGAPAAVAEPALRAV